jgi:hypothetical protein
MKHVPGLCSGPSGSVDQVTAPTGGGPPRPEAARRVPDRVSYRGPDQAALT